MAKIFLFYFRSFLLLFLFYVPASAALAEQASTVRVDSFIITRRILSVEDGLASRGVNCGLQDKRGFIWLGTRSGLNRYDGLHFKLFTKQDGGLSDNKIIGLTQDSLGLIWIFYGVPGSTSKNTGVIDILDPVTFSIKNFSDAFPNAPVKQQDINFAENNGKGGLYIVTYNASVWRYTPGTGFTCIRRFNSSYYPRFACHGNNYFIAIKNDTSVFGYGTGVTYFPAATKQDILYPLYFDSLERPVCLRYTNTGAMLFTLTPGGALLPGGRLPGGKNLFNDVWTSYDVYSSTRLLPGDEINYVRNGTVIRLFSKEETEKIPGILPRLFFSDNTGQLWLCTAAGVVIIKISPNHFHNYFSNYSSYKSQVRGIYADSSGNLYAAAWDALCLCRPDEKNRERCINSYGIFSALMPLNSKTLLLYGEYNYRYEMKKDNAALAFLLSSRNFPWAVYKLSDNRILVSSFNYCAVWDTAGRVMPLPCPAFNAPPPQPVYRFFKSKDGRLWGAGENGLHVFDNNGCVIDYYGQNAKDLKHRLPFTDLNDAHEDAEGIFWLATNGDGLYRWNRQQHSFKQFSLARGLSSNILYRIEEDDLGNLWISSDYGLICFNITTFKAYTYTADNGIPHNEFDRISSYKGPDGRLYFGGLNGVCGFNPADFVTDTAGYSPPLRITSFSQFSSKQGKIADNTIQLIQSRKITLQPGDKFFTLGFNLMDYEPSAHRYAYKIEGSDKDWNYITENSIRISGLPYGDFKLRIRGQNIKGQWSSNELNLAITVLRPFYLQAWFIVLIVIVVALAIYGIAGWRIRQLAREKERLENTVAQRTVELQHSLGEKEMLLKEIHHRVKNNLQIISSLLELQGSRLGDSAAKKALEEGKGRVQSIAVLHHQLYRHDDLAHVELCAFTRELFAQIMGVYRVPGQQLKAEIAIPEIMLDIDTAVPLGLILNELMTNSFKYAFSEAIPGTLNITVTRAGNTYTLLYSDNGPGLPPAFDISMAKSLGLRLVWKLSKQLKGSTAYRFNNGAEFSICFPAEAKG